MLKNYPDVKIFIAIVLNFINFAPLIVSKDKPKKTIDMKKTLLSALKHGSGILLSIFALLCSCQVWAETYTVYFLRPDTWGNTPNIHIWYGSDTKIVDNQAMSNVAANLFSYEFSTEQTSIGVMFNNGGWNNGQSNSNFTGWNPVSNTYFKCSGSNTDVTTYVTRSFSAGEYIYLKNIIPQDWSSNWINTSDATYAYLYTWGGTAGVHTYRFNLIDGTEGGTNSIYGAQFTTGGTYAYFILTRGGTEYGDGQFPSSNLGKTGDVPYDAVKNYIVSYTVSVTSVTWDVFNPCTEPTVTTASSPAAKAATTATLTGSYTTEDVCVPTAKGVAYRVDGGSYLYQTDGTSASGSISVSLSGLTPRTSYYYKAYVELEGGKKVFGAENSFVTDCMSGVTVSDPSSAGEGPKCSGDSFTALNVTAGGASSYTYQWYYNSSASTSGAIAIPGATSSSYTPAMVGANYYYCSVGAAGGYCEVASGFSGLTTINAVPTLIATPSSVTNYAPVTITASGAEISSWSITSGEGGYLYKTGATSAKFKGNVGSGSAVTYTIEGTAANGCSGTTTVTVNKNADSCE